MPRVVVTFSLTHKGNFSIVLPRKKEVFITSLAGGLRRIRDWQIRRHTEPAYQRFYWIFRESDAL